MPISRCRDDTFRSKPRLLTAGNAFPLDLLPGADWLRATACGFRLRPDSCLLPPLSCFAPRAILLSLPDRDSHAAAIPPRAILLYKPQHPGSGPKSDASVQDYPTPATTWSMARMSGPTRDRSPDHRGDRLPREQFVPAQMRDMAYIDFGCPSIGHGRFLMEPMVIARLVQLLAPIEGEQALVIGCGSGYGAALLGGLRRPRDSPGGAGLAGNGRGDADPGWLRLYRW